MPNGKEILIWVSLRLFELAVWFLEKEEEMLMRKRNSRDAIKRQEESTQKNHLDNEANP